MTAIIPLAQIIAGVCWLVASAYFSPSVWRLLISLKSTPRDLFGGVLFFIGLTQAGFTLRWLVWSHSIPSMSTTELSWWLAIYVSSAVEAIVMVIGTIVFRRWRYGV